MNNSVNNNNNNNNNNNSQDIDLWNNCKIWNSEYKVLKEGDIVFIELDKESFNLFNSSLFSPLSLFFFCKQTHTI